jgi:hypothetical protein
MPDPGQRSPILISALLGRRLPTVKSLQSQPARRLRSVKPAKVGGGEAGPIRVFSQRRLKASGTSSVD